MDGYWWDLGVCLWLSVRSALADLQLLVFCSAPLDRRASVETTIHLELK
jgi:hypothetical protein